MHPVWILLVEDDPDHAALALRVLRRFNVAADAVVAASGPEALAVLAGQQPPGRERWPRLVLLDLKLKSGSGFDVLRQLRASAATAGLPVVVLSSSDEESDKERSYSLGANSYLQKPVDYEAFVSLIRQVGHYWLTINQVSSGR